MAGLNVDGKSGPAEWMENWTIFYRGWWISLTPFMGMFIAKISRGRTVAELIQASLILPTLYTFIFFSVFGGSGLRMEREAVRDGCLGQCLLAYRGMHFNNQYCSQTDRHVFPSGSVQEIARYDLFISRRPEGCGSIRQVFCRSLSQAIALSPTLACLFMLNHDQITQIVHFGAQVPMHKHMLKCKHLTILLNFRLTQLSLRQLHEMWFDVLSGYKNLGTLFTVLSLAAMLLSNINVSDSGAIVSRC
jgi:hypothetical protein